MASHINFFVMAVMCLATLATMVAPRLALEVIEDNGSNPSVHHELIASEPASDGPKHTSSDIDPVIHNIPPEPRPGFFRKLERCVQKLSQRCGGQIFRSIFINGALTDECCDRLVLMGRQCHDEVIELLLIIPEFKVKAAQVLPKSNLIWNQSVRVTSGSPSSAPSPYTF